MKNSKGAIRIQKGKSISGWKGEDLEDFIEEEKNLI